MGRSSSTTIAINGAATPAIRHNSCALPAEIPVDHIGPVMLRGTGRLVWWTGRVAIGLRHEPQRESAPSQSAAWIQSLMIDEPARRAAGR